MRPERTLVTGSAIKYFDRIRIGRSETAAIFLAPQAGLYINGDADTKAKGIPVLYEIGRMRRSLTALRGKAGDVRSGVRNSGGDG